MIGAATVQLRKFYEEFIFDRVADGVAIDKLRVKVAEDLELLLD